MATRDFLCKLGHKGLGHKGELIQCNYYAYSYKTDYLLGTL